MLKSIASRSILVMNGHRLWGGRFEYETTLLSTIGGLGNRDGIRKFGISSILSALEAIARSGRTSISITESYSEWLLCLVIFLSNVGENSLLNPSTFPNRPRRSIANSTVTSLRGLGHFLTTALGDQSRGTEPLGDELVFGERELIRQNVEVLECTCERCGHVWFAQLARNEKGKIAPVVPIACSNCKSAY